MEMERYKKWRRNVDKECPKKGRRIQNKNPPLDAASSPLPDPRFRASALTERGMAAARVRASKSAEASRRAGDCCCCGPSWRRPLPVAAATAAAAEETAAERVVSARRDGQAYGYE
jgi:hypothetical protein